VEFAQIPPLHWDIKNKESDSFSSMIDPGRFNFFAYSTSLVKIEYTVSSGKRAIAFA
jgi:hypothetical protein